jgi:hypothetical protein
MIKTDQPFNRADDDIFLVDFGFSATSAMFSSDPFVIAFSSLKADVIFGGAGVF